MRRRRTRKRNRRQRGGILGRKSRRRKSRKSHRRKSRKSHRRKSRRRKSRKSHRRKFMKGGTDEIHSNTKQFVIKTTIDNFSNFKVFLKKISNIKNVDKEPIKYLKKLNQTELKELLNKIPRSGYEKIMKMIPKKKNMRGGSIILHSRRYDDCKKNTLEDFDGDDPVTNEPLGDNGARIMKDDSFGDDAYCYNDTTICDNGRIRDTMAREPYLRREWSSDFLNELACLPPAAAVPAAAPAPLPEDPGFFQNFEFYAPMLVTAVVYSVLWATDTW